MGGTIFISKKEKAKIRNRRRKQQKIAKSQSESDKKPPSKEKEQNPESKITVSDTISSNSKEFKKFRKDARRQARKDGKGESKLIFVNEDDVPFPSASLNNSGATNKSSGTKRSIDETTNNNNDDDANNTNSAQTKSKKRPKKSYPKINELLQIASLNAQKAETTQKLNNYLNTIHKNITDRYVALDCEMVGIGSDGKRSALARVSLTNWEGNVLLDTFVQVPDRVTDFRTFVSGVRPKDIQSSNTSSMELHACRKQVGNILKDKIVIGHALKNDFDALLLSHPKHLIRDSARYKPLMRASGRNGGKMRPRKLRDLVKEFVGTEIQKEGEEHSSVEDAKATMELYKCMREKWEKDIDKKEAERFRRSGKKKKKIVE